MLPIDATPLTSGRRVAPACARRIVNTFEAKPCDVLDTLIWFDFGLMSMASNL